MATFAQYLKNDKLRRVTYVCGPERVFVEEVVDKVRVQVGAKPIDSFTLDASTASFQHISAVLVTYPSVPKAARFVLVREASSITNWQWLQEWVWDAKDYPTTFVVFVGGQDGLDPLRSGGQRIIKSYYSGLLVDCKALSFDVKKVGVPSDSCRWLNSFLPTLSEWQSQAIWARCGGDSARVRDVCGAIKVTGAEKYISALDSSNDRVGFHKLLYGLCSQQPVLEFVDNLILGDKKAALSSVPSSEELGRVIGRLAFLLGVLEQLYMAMVENEKSWEAARDRGISPALAQKYGTAGAISANGQRQVVAKHYDPDTVQRCRSVLMACDSAYGDGARDGIVEALVAAWG